MCTVEIYMAFVAILNPSISGDDQGFRRGTPGDGTMSGSVALRAAFESGHTLDPVVSSAPEPPAAPQSGASAASVKGLQELEPFFGTPGHHMFGAAHELALFCCASQIKRRNVPSFESGSDRELFSLFKTLRQ